MAENTGRPDPIPRAPGAVGATIVKIVALGILDAVAVFAVFTLLATGEWLIAAVVVAVTALVNWIYLRRGGLPAKYLAPGLIFLAVFQLFIVVYTGYVGFTNYGDGHNSSKEDAIASILANARERVPDSPEYRLTVVETGGQLGFLVTDPDGEVWLGTADSPLSPVSGAELDSDGKAISISGSTSLTFADTIARQQEIVAMEVPLSVDLNEGVLRTADGSTAFLYTSPMVYDETADTFTDTRTGTVYADNGQGSFEDSSGQTLSPGWRVVVGFDNFASAFGEESIRGPLLGVMAWTFVFAAITVFTTFALGTFLALVFNDRRMRGRKIYRIVMILPYAFPAFLTGLVWAGLLNPQFGFVNEVLLGGADIPWLTHPWLARVSVLFVNLWLGYPYFFLVSTGALQSIPEEIQEAAVVDGAGPWQLFRLIKLPLLLVSLAPLLIASFAFNFNNFNVIYMLTGGGPTDVSSSVNAGATDLLITLVYKVAFTGTHRDYGLASAFSIIIFVVVAVVSIISFRRTKVLEDIH
ncbi:MAG: ABC transporter permease subunit [Protaetiibacter sp.]